MISREVSGERDNNGSDGKTAWDTLKEIPFALYKEIKKDQERKQRREQKDEKDRQAKLNEWIRRIATDPYARQHENSTSERQAHECAILSNRNEKEFTVREMAKGREEAEKAREDHFRKERLQELIERDFNAILTTEDKLRESIEFGDDRIKERTVSYQGKELSVYDLEGLPFSLLVHDLDFRSDPNQPAHWLSRKNIEDPSNWAKNIEESKQSNRWGTASGEGNAISVSFLSPMTLETGNSDSVLTYGFSHVEAGSIISISSYDAATNNMISDDAINLDMRYINAARERATLKEKQEVYDEIHLKRYSETGEPKKPDYIVVRNGRLTDTVLKHAAFWKIPIIDINKAAYKNNSARIENSVA